MPHPYVVCMTSLNLDGVKRQVFGKGIDACYSKPIFTAVVAGIIEKAQLHDPCWEQRYGMTSLDINESNDRVSLNPFWDT